MSDKIFTIQLSDKEKEMIKWMQFIKQKLDQYSIDALCVPKKYLTYVR